MHSMNRKKYKPSSATIDLIPVASSEMRSENQRNLNENSIATKSANNAKLKVKQRKHLRDQLCRISNVMCFLGILGILLMIINNEIIFTIGHNHDNIFSWIIKLIISLSTILLICFIIYYHRLSLKFYSLKNSFEDWTIELTMKKFLLILFEIIICSIHPVPRQLYKHWSTNVTLTQPVPMTYTSIDVVLGLPMFARLYLVCRVMLFHSHLIHNVSSQSLGNLNQVSLDFFFLIKTYLDQWPIRCLMIFSTSIFFIISWALRACNYRSTGEHISMFDSMWLSIITLTTVGYGDIIPTTYCGRVVAGINALIGILSTALLISVLAQKLVLTRWEKYVHNFVLNIELARNRKEQAANVVKFSVKLWYSARKNGVKSTQFKKVQSKLYHSINILKDIKLKQRQLIDNCVVLADLFSLQRYDNGMREKLAQQIATIQTNIDDIDQKFCYINQTMINVEGTLHSLMNRLQKNKRFDP